MATEKYLSLAYDRMHELIYDCKVIHADELCKALHNSSYVKCFVM